MKRIEKNIRLLKIHGNISYRATLTAKMLIKMKVFTTTILGSLSKRRVCQPGRQIAVGGLDYKLCLY
jgi:putative exporter of polyketide antibiotics